jgi:hypothetical protein
VQGTFNEIMELRDFPFDFQDLTIKCQTGLLTQGGQGGRPAAVAARLHRIRTHFLLDLHGSAWNLEVTYIRPP